MPLGFITRLVQRPKVSLSPEIDAEPSGHWTCRLSFDRGGAKGHVLAFNAQLTFTAALIEGAGRVGDDMIGDAEVSISGSRSCDHVELNVWIDSEGLASQPFVLSGHIDTACREILGDWDVDCFLPKTCKCPGYGGGFSMKKLGDED